MCVWGGGGGVRARNNEVMFVTEKIRFMFPPVVNMLCCLVNNNRSIKHCKRVIISTLHIDVRSIAIPILHANLYGYSNDVLKFPTRAKHDKDQQSQAPLNAVQANS